MRQTAQKTQTINFAKYEHMSERQLLTSLLNAEQREVKLKQELQKKLKTNSELIKFLKTKLKKRIDSPRPRYDFVPYEQTESYKFFKEYEATLTEAERAELLAQVEADVNRSYDDDDEFED